MWRWPTLSVFLILICLTGSLSTLPRLQVDDVIITPQKNGQSSEMKVIRVTSRKEPDPIETYCLTTTNGSFFVTDAFGNGCVLVHNLTITIVCLNGDKFNIVARSSDSIERVKLLCVV